jgi:hypothetical protein
MCDGRRLEDLHVVANERFCPASGDEDERSAVVIVGGADDDAELFRGGVFPVAGCRGDGGDGAAEWEEELSGEVGRDAGDYFLSSGRL